MSQSTVDARARLTDISSHFAFGENWRSFVDTVDAPALEAARRCLAKLVTPEEMRGARLLDIGCGSGLSMLAALDLGATAVEGIDIDPGSVGATRTLFIRAGKPCQARVASVLDLDPGPNQPAFDIVHSWGVLHHTGAMWQAIERASALVRPGGLFVVALYRKTPMCGFWRAEKRLYAHGSPAVQAAIGAIYKSLFALGMVVKGRNPMRYIREYPARRGMRWRHDVHDWLGGYPYESVTQAELADFLSPRGFKLRRQFVSPPGSGLMGSGCDEYVWERRTG